MAICKMHEVNLLEETASASVSRSAQEMRCLDRRWCAMVVRDGVTVTPTNRLGLSVELGGRGHFAGGTGGSAMPNFIWFQVP